MKSLTTITILALALSACAGNYNPRYRINEIVVNNNSRETVRDVTIRAGNRVFSCGNIAPLGICSNRFVGWVYQTSPVDVEWTLGNDAPRSAQLEVSVPATVAISQVVRGVVDIEPQGGLDVSLMEQYSLL